MFPGRDSRLFLVTGIGAEGKLRDVFRMAGAAVARMNFKALAWKLVVALHVAIFAKSHHRHRGRYHAMSVAIQP